MAVTNFKWWVNRTPGNVMIMKREDGASLTVAPGQFEERDVWVPWVDNATDFAKKVMVIEMEQPARRYYVWQHGDNVCFSTQEKFQSPAHGVPGLSGVSGERKLFFHPDGRFEVTPA
ncbi:MAG: hypothetical protein ACK4YP_12275 [Myxococcota bacterium]